MYAVGLAVIPHLFCASLSAHVHVHAHIVSENYLFLLCALAQLVSSQQCAVS